MIKFNEIGKITIENNQFFIDLSDDYYKATKGLEGFSHIQVIWYCNLYDSNESRALRVVEKPYKSGPDELGIFATRSPVRPNPIAITPCPIIRLCPDEKRIQIAYIDAEADTPILDIKPYEGCIDRIRDTSSPEWASNWPKYYEDSANFDWSSVFNF